MSHYQDTLDRLSRRNASRRNLRPFRRVNPLTLPVFAIALIALIGIVGYMGFHASTANTMTCTVTGKDRVASSNGSSDMRVYTSDCGTLTVGDMLIFGTFNSADIYGALEEGKTYKMTVSGARVPILSMFPVITEATEVK